MTVTKIHSMGWTTEGLDGLSENGKRYKIIDGALLTRVPYVDHQDVAGAIYSELL